LTVVLGLVPSVFGDGGACCLESKCVKATAKACAAKGGTYQGDGTECGPDSCGATPKGACCLGENECAELTEDHCVAEGGDYQGNATECHPLACGQVCGGIAGLGCDPGEFCKLNMGECCCDFQGICLAIPDACPTVYDPVCGCDGLTYGNECEAEIVGVSVDYVGKCDAILHGDVDESGDIDVGDVLCVVAGFENVMTCPGGDIVPCLSDLIIDVGDVLSVLSAFSGYFDCP
jgi:hypothetical protein